ncbi:MAG: helix-turn-helix domain-containing protein [Intestinibacter sp.]|uniref:helix-turn-helix domain-containing protein n=1 Tax=Intestinibacter sp. TaxID=1965304 RepID=UPI0025C33942|nr:helix-turn-helix transcriptional regulator [Intestinibacter sp.]MCI6737578.1 helix-turn-helix domain-containing protein [Intestinibacter sp.]
MNDLPNINMEIGKKIKNIRKSKNMTIQELANSINKSKSTVSKYENGDISIDIQTLYEISNALNVHVEQLLYIKSNIDNIHNNNIVNALKMLFSKKPLEENTDLVKKLKISKEDIKLMKLYNMFTVTQ